MPLMVFPPSLVSANYELLHMGADDPLPVTPIWLHTDNIINLFKNRNPPKLLQVDIDQSKILPDNMYFGEKWYLPSLHDSIQS